MAAPLKVLKPKKVFDNRPDEIRKPIKLILLGDSAVGKSKLVERFLMQRYIPMQMSTYALTLYRYDFVTDEDEEVDVDVWDTAGQERFATVHPSYYHDAHACILVFDCTRKATYKNLEKWLSEMRIYREHIPCIVACNKIDTDPSVTTKSFAFAEKHKFPLYYVSAADGSNVVQLFETAISTAAAYKKNPAKEDFMTQVIGMLKEDRIAADAAAVPSSSS
ncbi:ADP-ribosylation factor family/Ras of Complex, Roc, domain of DAPkinase [Leishmania naiffi]|uniref:ADP-ribosylation factor family/Ras of Complex, Roc, domain of DAPkinase n=1 Tax=Leishmania naiffi TaxID=5678 RepID=A0AAW3BAZ7_9TRYP